MYIQIKIIFITNKRGLQFEMEFALCPKYNVNLQRRIQNFKNFIFKNLDL